MLLPDLFADLDVRVGPVPRVLSDPVGRGVLWQTGPGVLLLEVPDVARFLVEDGRSMTIEPWDGADPRVVARFAGMTPLAAVAWQRGMLALHAAAVVGPSGAGAGAAAGAGMDAGAGAALLCGESAVGKSVLAAALLDRGWSVLADDLAILAFDEGGRAHVVPAAPELRLWPDALEQLGLAGRSAEQDLSGRWIVPAGGSSEASAPEVATVWVLSTHAGDDLEVKGLDGADRFRSVTHLAYNTQIAATLLDGGAGLRSVSRLMRAVPVRRARRPRGVWSVEALADAVQRGRER